MRLIALSLILLTTACAAITEPEPDVLPFAEETPDTRWDFRPESEVWTGAALDALDAHASPLTEVVPADIARFCPAYPAADVPQRQAFWVGLISALAKHESTWRPDAVGGGGRWFGLLQIAPATARGYGCQATSGGALKSGAANLSCGLRIMARTVTRDGVIAAGGRGIAADWGPFTRASKVNEMAAWTRQQAYCTAGDLAPQ